MRVSLIERSGAGSEPSISQDHDQFLPIRWMDDKKKFGTRQDVAKLLSIHVDNVKKLRDRYWQEGIHWVYLEGRSVRYIMPLIEDWLENRNDPVAHKRAQEVYRAQMLCNQPKPRGRKAS